MDQTGVITLNVLLNWLYQKYVFIFIICLLGAFIRDIADTYKNKTTINIKKIISSSLICSLILTAIMDYITNISVSLYVLICFFTGLWSLNIIDYVMNWKFVKRVIGRILGSVKNNVANSVAATLDEIDNENKFEEEENKKDDNEENDDG